MGAHLTNSKITQKKCDGNGGVSLDEVVVADGGRWRRKLESVPAKVVEGWEHCWALHGLGFGIVLAKIYSTQILEFVGSEKNKVWT